MNSQGRDRRPQGHRRVPLRTDLSGECRRENPCLSSPEKAAVCFQSFRGWFLRWSKLFLRFENRQLVYKHCHQSRPVVRMVFAAVPESSRRSHFDLAVLALPLALAFPGIRNSLIFTVIIHLFNSVNFLQNLDVIFSRKLPFWTLDPLSGSDRGIQPIPKRLEPPHGV